MLPQGSGLKLMTQFQTEVPYPLAQDMPALLTPGRVTTPAIGVLLDVFISQSIFKRAAMQVERHHIRSRKAVLGESRQEEFIDDPGAGDSDPTFGSSSGMSRDDEADLLASSAQGLIRTVVERPRDPTFWLRQVLICR
jgi:hypothetical protein